MAVLCLAVVALAVTLYRQWETLRELRNAHVNLAAEVGVVRRGCAEDIGTCQTQLLSVINIEARALSYRLDIADAYTKSLNERLVLLEIEKTATPKEPEDPAPPRRSFASQKARAEAGARK